MLTVIGLITLNETPAIDVDHLTPRTVFAAQHIIATYSLAKRMADFHRPGLLRII
jgi:hypothetical protein